MQNAPMLPPLRSVNLFLRVRLVTWVPVFIHSSSKDWQLGKEQSGLLYGYLSSAPPKDLNHALWKNNWLSATE